MNTEILFMSFDGRDMLVGGKYNVNDNNYLCLKNHVHAYTYMYIHTPHTHTHTSLLPYASHSLPSRTCGLDWLCLLSFRLHIIYTQTVHSVKADIYHWLAGVQAHPSPLLLRGCCPSTSTGCAMPVCVRPTPLPSVQPERFITRLPKPC